MNRNQKIYACPVLVEHDIMARAMVAKPMKLLHCIIQSLSNDPVFNNEQLFTEVEVNSDGYLPSREAAR